MSELLGVSTSPTLLASVTIPIPKTLSSVPMSCPSKVSPVVSLVLPVHRETSGVPLLSVTSPVAISRLISSSAASEVILIA